MFAFFSSSVRLVDDSAGFIRIHSHLIIFLPILFLPKVFGGASLWQLLRTPHSAMRQTALHAFVLFHNTLQDLPISLRIQP